MKGLAAVYAIAPRVLAVAAFATAIAVGSLLSRPELMMRTALTAPLPSGPVHYDEVVDQRDFSVSKLVVEEQVGQSIQESPIFPAGLYGHVSPGDRIPVALGTGKLEMVDITDVRELGKLIVPGSGQNTAKDYLLLIGHVVGQSDGEPVRLIVDAKTRPPFDAHKADDRRSL